jgi:hypothetical protein
MKTTKLSFGRGNAKLDKLEAKLGQRVYTFSILSGVNCPYAKECKSTAIMDSQGKLHIQDGPYTKFRCFSASQEVLFKNVYKSRKENGDFILTLAAQSSNLAAQALADSLPKLAGIVRIHVGGDFKTQSYFDAWLKVAERVPSVVFYAYTKSLPFWIKRRDTLPANFILTASAGGMQDKLIEKHSLRYAKVVYSELEAEQLGLEIDHDDSHAAIPALRDNSFALLLHGMQPKGSEASKALNKLKGVGSYGKTK